MTREKDISKWVGLGGERSISGYAPEQICLKIFKLMYEHESCWAYIMKIYESKNLSVSHMIKRSIVRP